MLIQTPMKIVTRVIATTGVCVAVAACGQTTSSSTPALVATSAPTVEAAATTVPPTVAPTVGATSAIAPTTSPTSDAVPTAVARPRPADASTPAAASSATAVRLVIDSSASQASYYAREQLVGKSLPSDAIGTSKSVSGSVVLGSDGSVLADQSKISVDLTKLQSDESRRDNLIKNDTLQTSRFPMATFVPNAAQGLPTPLPTSGELTFQLLGDLTVHGVTKPVTWQITAQFADATVSGTATTNVNITDFGMTPPRVGPVLSIEDALRLELAFTAARG